MTNMLKGSNGRHFSARWLRPTAVAVVGVALSVALWTATVPTAFAQGDGNVNRLIEDNLRRGQTIANASKADLLAAICSAVQKNRQQAPQIARVATQLRPDLAQDILRTIFRCLGNDDCRLLGRVLRSMTQAAPNDASALTNLALELAPDCAPVFPCGPGDPGDGGNFGQGPGNQLPPPGTIGGGGGQGNVVTICHNGKTIFVSPQGAQNHLNNHPGDSAGACVVTPASSK